MRFRFVIMALTCLALAACSVLAPAEPTASPTLNLPTATATQPPTLTPTKTATPTRTPTSTPLPPTPTPTMTALEIAQQALYEGSLKFIAPSPDEATLMARRIDFASGPYESADNMCGPLAAAILIEGGYLPADAPVHDMWLLCPREDNPDCEGLETLRRIYFPVDEYEYTRVEESVGKFDFSENPLQPGDWLYLYVMKGVSNYDGFDHMLVVTRVDPDGAAYTVTNINHGDGFIITEELLYDPNRPGKGLFYDLTNDRLRKELGMTGTAGFLLIRAKHD